MRWRFVMYMYCGEIKITKQCVSSTLTGQYGNQKVDEKDNQQSAMSTFVWQWTTGMLQHEALTETMTVTKVKAVARKPGQ